MVGRAGGDSSESHDTDHLADELDSPPLVSFYFLEHINPSLKNLKI